MLRSTSRSDGAAAPPSLVETDRPSAPRASGAQAQPGPGGRAASAIYAAQRSSAVAAALRDKTRYGRREAGQPSMLPQVGVHTSCECHPFCVGTQTRAEHHDDQVGKFVAEPTRGFPRRARASASPPRPHPVARRAPPQSRRRRQLLRPPPSSPPFRGAPSPNCEWQGRHRRRRPGRCVPLPLRQYVRCAAVPPSAEPGTSPKPAPSQRRIVRTDGRDGVGHRLRAACRLEPLLLQAEAGAEPAARTDSDDRVPTNSGRHQAAVVVSPPGSTTESEGRLSGTNVNSLTEVRCRENRARTEARRMPAHSGE
jgi:hypothetical protein